MQKINVLKCCRCGSVPKATKHGEWYRIFCPKCHIGRSKHACNDLYIVAWEWNNRAKRENMKIDCQYPIKYVDVEIVDETPKLFGRRW